MNTMSIYPNLPNRSATTGCFQFCFIKITALSVQWIFIKKLKKINTQYTHTYLCVCMQAHMGMYIVLLDYNPNSEIIRGEHEKL